jgi:hypothetical protein
MLRQLHVSGVIFLLAVELLQRLAVPSPNISALHGRKTEMMLSEGVLHIGHLGLAAVPLSRSAIDSSSVACCSLLLLHT